MIPNLVWRIIQPIPLCIVTAAVVCTSNSAELCGNVGALRASSCECQGRQTHGESSDTVGGSRADKDAMQDAASGNLAGLKKYLNAGNDVNGQFWNGETLLMIASAYGRQPVIEELLARKAALSTVSPLFGTALDQAVMAGNLEAVRLLVAHGARLTDSADSPVCLWDEVLNVTDGDVPLIVLAAAHGRDQVIDYLLKSGRGVEERGSAGETALLVAAKAGMNSCVAHLVRKGANVAAVDRRRNGIVMYAAMSGHADTLELISRYIKSPDGQNDEGETALSFAARNLLVDAVVALLGTGANPNIADKMGRTPIMLACSADFGDMMDSSRETKVLPVVRALTDAKADITLTDKSGNTALGNASKHGHLKAASFLRGRLADARNQL